MRVGISRTKDRRHSREVACMVQVRARRPDEAACEGNQAAVARGMPGDKFCSQAGALGKAADKYALERYAPIHGKLYHRAYLCQGGGYPGLVFRDRRHERKGIPAMI